jgi:hypothetical protein
VPDIVSLEIRQIEIRSIGGFTHKLENILNLRIMAYQVPAAYEADTEHAYLTVISTVIVNFHQDKYYSDKGGYARSGVDLPNGID